MKKLLIISLSLVLFLGLSSFLGKKNPVKDSKKNAQIVSSILAGEAIDNGSLKKYARELKGEKLTFKEKIALRIFSKKIKSKKLSPNGRKGGKGRTITLILCWFVGGLGVHRFYLGYTWQGVVQLLTAGGCGVWWLIDLIRIITGDLQPLDGSYDPDWA